MRSLSFNKCAVCGAPAARQFPTMGGGVTHLCNRCPHWKRDGDEPVAEEPDRSAQFAEYARRALESFGIDPDEWVEEQDRKEREGT